MGKIEPLCIAAGRQNGTATMGNRVIIPPKIKHRIVICSNNFIAFKITEPKKLEIFVHACLNNTIYNRPKVDAT